MIMTDLEHLSGQVALMPNIEKAINFLHRSDLASLPEGRLVIDGEKVYAIVSEYVTKPFSEMVELEGHKKYVDIHFLVTGREVIGWASAKTVRVTVRYDESTDAWNGNLHVKQLTHLRLAAGQAAVLFPSDAHAPQAADGTPVSVRKIVVKVALP